MPSGPGRVKQPGPGCVFAVDFRPCRLSQVAHLDRRSDDMSPKIDVINLGVNDPERARQFYEGGLGATVGTEDRALVVNLGPNASRLALREWEVAAREAGVEA